MIEKAIEWIQDGREVALATVIAAWGSSPRRLGSQMVISNKGMFEGSVSGGCIEGAVVEEALEVIRQGAPRRVFFGVTKDQAWEVGLACGGEIEIFVEKVSWEPILKQLFNLITAKVPACLITDLTSGEKILIAPDDADALKILPEEVAQHVTFLGYGERNAIVEAGGRSFFIHGFQPDPQLIIVGAVHIAKALVPIARTAGYQILIIDPREAFANTIRFPDVEMHVEWPDEALEHMDLYSRTAVVVLSHDPKLDDPALSVVLYSNAFYIGALGSKKTHAERLQRLKQAGFTDEILGKIHGPIGLDIGADTPEEIAIAIMAQITRVRRKGESSSWDEQGSVVKKKCFK